MPVSTIASLFAGECVGLVADNPDEIIEWKTFHAMVVNDHDALKLEKKKKYHSLHVVRKVDSKEIYANYKMIKQDKKYIVKLIGGGDFE